MAYVSVYNPAGQRFEMVDAKDADAYSSWATSLSNQASSRPTQVSTSRGMVPLSGDSLSPMSTYNDFLAANRTTGGNANNQSTSSGVTATAPTITAPTIKPFSFNGTLNTSLGGNLTQSFNPSSLAIESVAKPVLPNLSGSGVTAFNPADVSMAAVSPMNMPTRGTVSKPTLTPYQGMTAAQVREQIKPGQDFLDTLASIRNTLGQYSKDTAFSDAAGLVNREARKQQEKQMPAIQKAIEGSGTSAGSMQALLSSNLARDITEQSAALGAEQAKAYGGISANLQSTLASLVASGDPTSKLIAQALMTEMQGESARYIAGNQNATSMYNTDVGAEADAYRALLGAEAQRYSTDRGAASQDYGNLLQSNVSLSNAATAADTQRRIAEAQTLVQQYGIDRSAASQDYGNRLQSETSLSNAQLQALTQGRIAELGSRTDQYQSDVAAAVAAYNAGLGAESNNFNTSARSATDIYQALLGSQTSLSNAATQAATSRYVADTGANAGITQANIGADTSRNNAGLQFDASNYATNAQLFAAMQKTPQFGGIDINALLNGGTSSRY